MDQFLQMNQPTIILLATWSIFWKGWALWRASKNDQKPWYVAILVVNTVGLLEIAYLLFFQKKDRLWEKISQKLKFGSSPSVM